MGLSIGSDPEFLIVDRNQEPQSAIRVLPGHGKESKLAIGDQSIFYDNVLLEFNLRPARTLMEFQANFKECLDGATKILKKKGLYLNTRASITFPADQCEDDEACIFGCDPEFNIYHRTKDNKIMRVDPPYCEPGNTFRSCGGHIHIGHILANWENGGDPATIVKLMDAFVGVISVLVDKDTTSLARKKLYGGAGTHRITPYGLEYRTLSNFWFSSPSLMAVIYKLTRLVMEKALTDPKVIDDIPPQLIQKLVNDGNFDEAYNFYNLAIRCHVPYELQGSIDQKIGEKFYEYPEQQWSMFALAA